MRRLEAIILIAGTAICFSPNFTFGQDDARDVHREKTTILARLAPVYGASDVHPAGSLSKTPPQFIPLGIMNTNAVGAQIGITTYDYQHNCTMGRQVEHRNADYIHFDWMRQTDMILGGDRRIAYQAYDLQACGYVFASGGITVDNNYAGYASLDVDATNCPIPVGHEANYPRAFWNSCTGSIPTSTFSSDYPTDQFGWYLNAGTGPNNYNLWPKIDWQIGTAAVLHMVTAESGGATGQAQTISYYRRVGPYGTGQGVWSAQRVVDTVMSISPTVVASPTTDKVALVWVAPANYKRDTPDEFDSQYENDVWYALSNDQGASWMTGTGSIAHLVVLGLIPGGNITNYPASSDWKAYCDLSALISTDNELHVVWGCRRWIDTTTLFRRKSAIFHWSEDQPCVRPVVIADWDTGGTCAVPAWGSDVAKMSISECDGKLYVLYTQFGNAAQPCYDFDATKNVLNGELYLTGSMDHGYSWDTPHNLTNSVTPNCTSGNCESDYWASMARYGRMEIFGGNAGQNVLDILYINDRAPGGVVQPESGIWTTNPVMWLSTPCFIIDPLCQIGASPDAISAFLKPVVGNTLDTQFVIANTGNTAVTITPVIRYLSGDNWITRHVLNLSTIPTGCNGSTVVELTLTAPQTEGLYRAELLYIYDAGTELDTLVVPVQLFCSLLDFTKVSVFSSELWSVRGVDLDFDNNIDIAFSSNLLDPGVRVAYNNGDGTYAYPVTIAGGETFTCGFVNQDSLQDIITIDSCGPSRCIVTFINRGGRQFTKVSTPFGIGYVDIPSMAAGYFNNDPYLDIVCTPYNILCGDGTGSFYPCGVLPTTIACADVCDFNTDGIDDIVTVGYDEASVYLNDGYGGFSQSGGFSIGGQSWSITTNNALADFDRDGNTDFALVTDNVQSAIYIAFGDGMGGIRNIDSIVLQRRAAQVATADFNRDGILDLVSGNTNWEIYLGDGNGGFSGPLLANSGVFGLGIASADIDRDGNPDLVTGSWFGDGPIILLLNNLPDGQILADEMRTIGYKAVSIETQNPYAFVVSRDLLTVGGSSYWRYDDDGDSTIDESAVDYNMIYGEYRIGIAALPNAIPGSEFSAIIKIDGTDQIRLFINYDLPFSKQGPDGRLTPDTIIFYHTVEPASSIQPPNGREATTNPPAFDWSLLVTSIAADSFHFQLDRFYDFHGAPMIADTSGLTTPVFTPGSPLGADSIFYWRFRSFVGGVWSSYSRTFAVYISGYTPGDANGDKVVNIGDAVYIVNYVFRGGPVPNPVAAADANCDSQVNIGDAVYLVNYIFRGGPAPCRL